MRNFKTLEWIGDYRGFLELTDQRRLPGEFVKLRCETVEQLYDAIKTLAVRGAPAIGVAAGFGVCIAAGQIKSNSKLSEAIAQLNTKIDYLAQSRPTAVNLFRVLDRMKTKAEKFASGSSDADISDLRKVLLCEAQKIYDEDVEMCRLIGINGEKFIPDGRAVLTHCNAGALATAGQGTALSPMFTAAENGKKFKVYACETRPLLQGARLTVWELLQSNIDVTLICDSMAAVLMKSKRIAAVITGADRIAANGDTANKIGTYGLSVLAKAHNVPFYIAAPSSTFDMAIKTGSEIPIEQREPEEVACFGRIRTAPQGVDVFNPAFDVTDAENITAIITEKGVIEKPDAEKIAQTIPLRQ